MHFRSRGLRGAWVMRPIHFSEYISSIVIIYKKLQFLSNGTNKGTPNMNSHVGSQAIFVNLEKIDSNANGH